jgi:hypothetical protein
MNSDTKNIYKLVGLVLLVVGIGLAFWGFQMSDSVTAKFSRALTGALPDGIMYRYLTGAACAAAGAFLLFKK